MMQRQCRVDCCFLRRTHEVGLGPIRPNVQPSDTGEPLGMLKRKLRAQNATFGRAGRALHHCEVSIPVQEMLESAHTDSGCRRTKKDEND